MPTADALNHSVPQAALPNEEEPSNHTPWHNTRCAVLQSRVCSSAQQKCSRMPHAASTRALLLSSSSSAFTAAVSQHDPSRGRPGTTYSQQVLVAPSKHPTPFSPPPLSLSPFPRSAVHSGKMLGAERGIMMSQRPGGGASSGGLSSATPVAPSVGNYKGVMLCNRPTGGGGADGVGT